MQVKGTVALPGMVLAVAVELRELAGEHIHLIGVVNKLEALIVVLWVMHFKVDFLNVLFERSEGIPCHDLAGRQVIRVVVGSATEGTKLHRIVCGQLISPFDEEVKRAILRRRFVSIINHKWKFG